MIIYDDMNYIIVSGCYGNYDETQLGEQKWNEMDNCQHDHHYPSITIMYSEEFQDTTTTTKKKKKWCASHMVSPSRPRIRRIRRIRPPWHKHRGHRCSLNMFRPICPESRSSRGWRGRNLWGQWKHAWWDQSGSTEIVGGHGQFIRFICYIMLLWCTMIYYDLLWLTMMYYELLWITMICYDLLWFTMMYYELLWITMICYDLLWFTMIYYDVLWYISRFLMTCDIMYHQTNL